MLGLALVFVIVAFVKYRNQPISDERTQTQKDCDYRIGVAMGALGYDISYAAVVRYALEQQGWHLESSGEAKIANRIERQYRCNQDVLQVSLSPVGRSFIYRLKLSLNPV